MVVLISSGFTFRMNKESEMMSLCGRRVKIKCYRKSVSDLVSVLLLPRKRVCSAKCQSRRICLSVLRFGDLTIVNLTPHTELGSRDSYINT